MAFTAPPAPRLPLLAALNPGTRLITAPLTPPLHNARPRQVLSALHGSTERGEDPADSTFVLCMLRRAAEAGGGGPGRPFAVEREPEEHWEHFSIDDEEVEGGRYMMFRLWDLTMIENVLEVARDGAVTGASHGLQILLGYRQSVRSRPSRSPLAPRGRAGGRSSRLRRVLLSSAARVYRRTHAWPVPSPTPNPTPAGDLRPPDLRHHPGLGPGPAQRVQGGQRPHADREPRGRRGAPQRQDRPRHPGGAGSPQVVPLLSFADLSSQGSLLRKCMHALTPRPPLSHTRTGVGGGSEPPGLARLRGAHRREPGRPLRGQQVGPHLEDGGGDLRPRAARASHQVRRGRAQAARAGRGPGVDADGPADALGAADGRGRHRRQRHAVAAAVQDLRQRWRRRRWW